VNRLFKNKTFIGLNLAVFLMMLGVGMIVALLPRKVLDLTGSPSMVGYLASSFALAYIILQLPIGNLSDRFGFKPFIAAGYLLCFLAGAVYYFSKSANLVFLGRMIQGAGEVPVWALAPALLSVKFPMEKGKVMGIYNATMHLGLTLGPVLGAILSGALAGNLPFIFYSAVCLAGAFVIHASVENINRGRSAFDENMNLKNLRMLMSKKQILTALIGITLYGAGYGIFLTVIPAFLITGKNYGQMLVSIFFSLFYVTISFSQIITGPLSDKMGRKFFMIAGLIIAAAGTAAFPALRQPWISVLLAVASLGLGVFYLSSMAFLNETVSDSLKGTISGAYYLFWGIGYFFGPVIVGKLEELSYYNMGFYVFALALFIEAAVLMATFMQSSSKKESPQNI